jgi:hypothetical protein
MLTKHTKTRGMESDSHVRKDPTFTSAQSSKSNFFRLSSTLAGMLIFANTLGLLLVKLFSLPMVAEAM